MDSALLIARFVLAAVFFTAGAAKLSDRPGSRAAIAGFGLPASLAAPLGVLLPMVEVVVAVALLPAASARWGALGALVLLALFVAGIANAMARGREAECHCFGQLHSSPVGWSTLGRNAALALVAGFVFVEERGGSGPSYADLLSRPSPVELVALIAAAFALALLAGGGWFMLHLLRQHGRVLVRLDALEKELAVRGLIAAPAGVAAYPPSGLPVGVPAPPFDASDLHGGGSTTLEELLAPGRPVMLVFSHPGCTPCSAMLPEIAGWQRTHRAELTIALISQGSIDDNRATAAEHGIERVLIQQGRELADAYEAYATPSAVLLSRDGIVASPVAQGRDAIHALLSDADGTIASARAAGTPAALALPHRNGGKASATSAVSLDGR